MSMLQYPENAQDRFYASVSLRDKKVAMAICGHKTRAVFDRYNIVSPGDLAEAARLIDQGIAKRQEPSPSTQPLPPTEILLQPPLQKHYFRD
jgi:hypothetical protein